VREEELLRRLRAAAECSCTTVRLTVEGGRLFVDGFVSSVDEKSQVESVCRQLAPDTDLVNRLRVASAEQQQVS
jgi:hypothetical protein